ncbi:MAG: RNA polymerase sigma-70 factor [Bacteroidetes bacterium]|nr:MAG: RNA polymerase sigma-70 factor [Bacteroidota bacterium]
MEQDVHSSAEQIVIARLRAGHEATFEAVFRQYYAGLCAYAHQYLKEKELAEEIVQQLFCKLWEKRQSLEIKSSLKSYLFNAVRNNCLSHLRHEKVKAEYRQYSLYRQAEVQLGFEDEVQQAELQQLIHAAIAALPEQCRRIFEMSRFEGMKYREIALTLGLSPKTIEAQMGKALKRIRQAVAAYRK